MERILRLGEAVVVPGLKVRTALSLALCLTSFAYALPSVTGTVHDSLQLPIEGAKITVWDANTGKGVESSSSKGTFTLTGMDAGDYLFKVEKDGELPVYGALHLAGDLAHSINIAMVDSGSRKVEGLGAGSPLRLALRPPRSSPVPPKVKPAQVKKKVTPIYPTSNREVGNSGVVTIAMIILPSGTLDDLVVLSAPNKTLAVAALMAVRQWRYSPTYLDGDPVEASLTIDVNFGR